MDQDQSQFEQQSEEQKTLDPHCMACNMPMSKDADYGTNLDGTKNPDYCCHCLQNGNLV